MPDKNFFIGLDIGTSGAKAVLFDGMGRQKSIAQKEYHFRNPKPGWSEIDPEEVWQKTVSVVRDCAQQSGVPSEKIKALGLSVLGETTIPLDEKANPLYPAIDSQDKKENGYQKYREWFDERFGADAIYERTSFPLSFIAPALRLQYFREFHPDIFTRIAKFVTFQDFALWRLTGSPAIDYSMASRTMMFDADKKEWIPEYLDAMDVPPEMLSEACLPTHIVGTLTGKMAETLGLHPDMMVAAGAHDQSCSALGIGAIREGIAADGTGSVEAISTPTEKRFTSPALAKLGFSSECHLLPDLYLALGYHLTAGSLVRWYRDQLGKHEQGLAEAENKSAYDLITDSAQSSPPGGNGLLVLPHWSGAGTGHQPMLNPASRGAFIGLTLAHEKSDLDRAIFEGITFEARMIIEAFEETGIPIETFVVTGGGAKSPFWLQLKADITDKQMQVPETTEASAMGAAMLGAIGSGYFNNLDEAVDRFCRIRTTFQPDPGKTKQYDRIFPIYNEIYDAVLSVNTKISSLDLNSQLD